MNFYIHPKLPIHLGVKIWRNAFTLFPHITKSSFHNYRYADDQYHGIITKGAKRIATAKVTTFEAKYLFWEWTLQVKRSVKPFVMD